MHYKDSNFNDCSSKYKRRRRIHTTKDLVLVSSAITSANTVRREYTYFN